jgi:hypothetical protein
VALRATPWRRAGAAPDRGQAREFSPTILHCAARRSACASPIPQMLPAASHPGASSADGGNRSGNLGA